MKNIKSTTSKKSESTTKTKPNAAMNLRDLLIDGLKDIYWAEKALTKALPKMVQNATASDLAYALKNHLEETKNHVTRLEEVFVSLDEKATAKKCVAMEGLINEADHIMEDTLPGAVRDAGIIAAAQKVEHYEIASYGTLATFARTLGEEEAAAILEEILAEEKAADEALSQLAEATINDEANDPDEDDEDDEVIDDDDEDEDEDELDEDVEDQDYDMDGEEEDEYAEIYTRGKLR
jgi:ferritin-like metal-binding protein YciE